MLTVISPTKSGEISDEEVRHIFRIYPCKFERFNGRYMQTAYGIPIREQYTRQGPLGYVIMDPLTGQRWIWGIDRRSRRPRPLGLVD